MEPAGDGDAEAYVGERLDAWYLERPRPACQAIQVPLNKTRHLHGGRMLVEDGAFAPAIDTAARAFQRFADGVARLSRGHGLGLDGIVGPDTMNALTFRARKAEN